MDDPSLEAAERELDQAREAFQDAIVLLNGAGSDSGTINRLYYATFHAAQAVLYCRGENPSSHGQVRQQFGQTEVLDGQATREEGRLLGTLYDYRQRADYGTPSVDVEVEELRNDVEAFISHMESIVDSLSESD